MHKIYITGIAGFIGFHMAERLAMAGYEVGGVDDFNDYYDPQLKRDRALLLETKFGIKTYDHDIEIIPWRHHLENYDAVIHLAAHAGVRHSLDHPQMYIDTNISATQRLIQACEDCKEKLPSSEQFIHVDDIKATLIKALEDSGNKDDKSKDWPHGI